MLFNWLNEEKTPGYLIRDRALMVIKHLSITTVEQIQTVTGWPETTVNRHIKGIRDIDRENYDKWLQAWSTGPKMHGGKHAYALGVNALKYADELKNEFNPHKEYYPARGQARHFIGTNEILCRTLRAGFEVESWFSQADTLSQLWFKLKPEKSPVRPDATIKLKDRQPYFLEFDTGSESGGRIEDRQHNYLQLQLLMESMNIGNVYPVVWVTFKETRAAFLERKWQEALTTFTRKKKSSLPNRIPPMFFVIEGQELPILASKELGKVKVFRRGTD